MYRYKPWVRHLVLGITIPWALLCFYAVWTLTWDDDAFIVAVVSFLGVLLIVVQTFTFRMTFIHPRIESRSWLFKTSFDLNDVRKIIYSHDAMIIIKGWRRIKISNDIEQGSEIMKHVLTNRREGTLVESTDGTSIHDMINPL